MKAAIPANVDVITRGGQVWKYFPDMINPEYVLLSLAANEVAKALNK